MQGGIDVGPVGQAGQAVVVAHLIQDSNTLQYILQQDRVVVRQPAVPAPHDVEGGQVAPGEVQRPELDS